MGSLADLYDGRRAFFFSSRQSGGKDWWMSTRVESLYGHVL